MVKKLKLWYLKPYLHIQRGAFKHMAFTKEERQLIQKALRDLESKGE